MVNSALMSIDPRQAVTLQSILLSRSTVYMALAMAALIAASLLPLARLAPRFSQPVSPPPPPTTLREWGTTLLGPAPLWLGVAALLFLLATVYFPVIGHEVNGSARWIIFPVPGLGPTTIQPSEFAKCGLIALLAWYGATRAHTLHRFTTLLPALAATAAIAGFVVLEDLGTGVLLGIVAAVMLLAAGARLWHLLIPAPFAALGLAAAVFTSPYRLRRLTGFLDPYADPEGTGYHMIQSLVAIANGRFFGRGLGHGLQKFGYLPEDHTDFLFAIICEELGVLGAAIVIAAYAAILWTGVVIVRRQPTPSVGGGEWASDAVRTGTSAVGTHAQEGGAPFLKLLGLGVLATVGVQALINLAVVTGMAPTKGIALPLLSSGGTGWILTAASLGLLVAMDRPPLPTPAPTDDPAAAAIDPAETASPVVVTPAGRSWLAPSK